MPSGTKQRYGWPIDHAQHRWDSAPDLIDLLARFVESAVHRARPEFFGGWLKPVFI
jgi:hypothetical protein